MKTTDLTPESLARIKARYFDRLIEKHEGPFRWEDVFQYDTPEFMQIGNYDVLLPLGINHHPNVTILRCLESSDASTLTLFLKDTTWVEPGQNEKFSAGFLAICERLPGETFYVASVYHEWFILPFAEETNVFQQGLN